MEFMLSAKEEVFLLYDSGPVAAECSSLGHREILKCCKCYNIGLQMALLGQLQHCFNKYMWYMHFVEDQNRNTTDTSYQISSSFTKQDPSYQY